MPNRKTKPTSPGRRFATYPLREQLTAGEPERKLTEGLRKSGGRNVSLSNYDLSTCPLYDLINFFASFTDDMHSDRARNLYLQFLPGGEFL